MIELFRRGNGTINIFSKGQIPKALYQKAIKIWIFPIFTFVNTTLSSFLNLQNLVKRQQFFFSDIQGHKKARWKRGIFNFSAFIGAKHWKFSFLKRSDSTDYGLYCKNNIFKPIRMIENVSGTFHYFDYQISKNVSKLLIKLWFTEKQYFFSFN